MKEKAWINYYFGEAAYNSTQAARLAGYKWPDKIGPAKVAKFRDELRERFNQQVMPVEEAMARMSKIGRAPQAEHLLPSGQPDMARIVKEGLGDLVKEVRKNVDGSVTVKFHDQPDALKTILQAHNKLAPPAEVNINLRVYSSVAEEVYGERDKESEAGDA